MKGIVKMSRMFMRGTKLENMEAMMMNVPNFTKTERGTYVFKSSANTNSGECIYCADYRKSKGCKHDCCPYMIQRIEMGAVSYETIINDCFRAATTRGIKRRLESLVKYFDGVMFWSDEHKYLFDSMLGEVSLVYDAPNLDYVAAIYMLTTTSELWNQVKDSVYLNNINFRNIKIKDVSVDSYAFYQAAKTIYTGEIKIEDKEMADNQIISSDAFKIMVHGKLVEKYGAELLKVTFKTGQPKESKIDSLGCKKK